VTDILGPDGDNVTDRIKTNPNAPGVGTGPDLSIIIPTYNRLPLLKEALASFVGLLECSWKIVIVDKVRLTTKRAPAY